MKCLFLSIFFSVILIAAAVDHVFDNKLAEICKPISKPLDILFVIDGSGSVGGATFDMQLELLNTVIGLVEIGENATQLGVLQYASYSFTEFTFKTHKSKDAVYAGIKKIRHKSGTTKTGKALDKAYQLFNDVNTGSRKNELNVEKIAIVVSDGHSHDDPYLKAQKLRDSGVTIIALGIGYHINMNELAQITDNPSLVFTDLQNEASLAKFTTAFKQLSIGEECEYAKGKDGAEINCLSDSFEIDVSTKFPFAGHLYVEGEYYDPKCSIKTNSTDIKLTVPLTECGISRQFAVNPHGYFFETKVILQFHPQYKTPLDRVFPIHCFYQDKVEDDETEIDWGLIKDHAQLKTKNEKMPCKYQIFTGKSETADCVAEDKLAIGEKVVHQWECDTDNFDTYQSMLVHSCLLIDLRNDIETLIVDENGCSVNENIINTPVYANYMKITTKGIIVSHPDSMLIKMKCSVRFCDRLMGECDEILPPKCNINIKKRQAGFAAVIRPLDEPAAQIVTFDKKAKTASRQAFADQRVGFSVSTKPDQRQNVNVISPRRAEIRLGTQPVQIVPRAESEDQNSQTDSPQDEKIEIETETTTPQEIDREQETAIEPNPATIPSFLQRREIFNQVIDGLEVNDPNDSFKGTDDPFQEKQKLSKDEQTAIERELLSISPELDQNIITDMSTSSITLESQTISVYTKARINQC